MGLPPLFHALTVYSLTKEDPLQMIFFFLLSTVTKSKERKTSRLTVQKAKLPGWLHVSCCLKKKKYISRLDCRYRQPIWSRSSLSAFLMGTWHLFFFCLNCREEIRNITLHFDKNLPSNRSAFAGYVFVGGFNYSVAWQPILILTMIYPISFEGRGEKVDFSTCRLTSLQ